MDRIALAEELVGITGRTIEALYMLMIHIFLVNPNI